MRMSRFQFVAAGFLIWAVGNIGVAAEGEKDADESPAFMTLKLVDEAGQPVSGAKVGVFVILREYDAETGGKLDFIREIESDADGVARYQEVVERLQQDGLIYARHVDRQLV